MDEQSQYRINLSNSLRDKIIPYKRFGLTPTEKLDVVLLIIKLYEIINDGCSVKNVDTHINPFPTENKPIVITNIEIKKVINVLKEKGLIESVDNEKYTVSFKGDYFMDDGGFSAEQVRKERHDSILENQSKTALGLQKMASQGAWWAFVVALCYLIFEILKFWHENNCGCIHH